MHEHFSRTSILSAVCSTLVLAATASAQVPAGGPLTIATASERSARLAMQPDGDFVVVWVGDDANQGGIFGQRFAASGDPRGGAFPVNTSTEGIQDLPAASVDRKGNLVVVWEGDTVLGSPGIQGRRYDAAGTPLGDEFAVNQTVTGYHRRPDVGHSGDGRFVVAWTSPFTVGTGAVRALQFDRAGHPAGEELLVAGQDFLLVGGQTAIEVQRNGTFVVVWDESAYYGSSGIRGQRFSAAGLPTGGDMRINTTTSGPRFSPSVSGGADGSLTVTWIAQSGDGSGTSVAARHYDSNGVPGPSEFRVNTYTTGYQFGYAGQVAHDDVGNFVVTWNGPSATSATAIHAQRFDASGARRGVEFEVSPPAAGARQIQPSIASDAVGNFVVVWEGFTANSTPTGVAAQRFGGLRPETLAVDTGGNGVLEAGETVDARPAWRNFSGAPRNVAGSLTGITGPAGAVYAIVDGAGGYGAVGDGVTAPCTDCYSLSVSNPGVRPALHWDASAVETMLPDAQGQQKRWLLHVGGTFADVPATSPYYVPIETLVHHGITAGCALLTADTYCPSAPTTRAEIAPLLLMAKEGSDYGSPKCNGAVFKDVKLGNPFCGFIEELARRGAITGCAPKLFCPTQVVTREEIAVLLLRTLDPAMALPLCVAPTFYNDVPATHPFCPWIEELARRGVVSDCGGGNYCPAAQVTREQAAFFITGTFALTLYGL